MVNKSGRSLNLDDVETISDSASSPAASPSYAKVAFRTPEQAEAIKAAEAARSVSKQPSSKSSKDSKDSVKQQPKKPPKPKTASEPPPSSFQKPSSDRKRTTQEKAERERHRHHHNHDRESSEEDSDHEFVKVRARRHSRPPLVAPMSLKIVSLKVGGLGTPAKRFTVLRELEHLNV